MGKKGSAKSPGGAAARQGERGAAASASDAAPPPMIEDARFAHAHNDPRFKRPSKRQQKVVIDDRFKSMFTDKRFQTAAKVDARGRKITHSQDEDLRRFYTTEQEELDRDPTEEAELFAETLRIDEEGESEASDSGAEPDYSRGEGLMESSDEDDDDDEAQAQYQEEADTPWTVFEALDQVDHTDDISRRLAIVNLDWDLIRAVDLYVLVNSFKPRSGVVERVAIFPSEFGRERMAEEDRQGPGRLIRESLPDPPPGVQVDKAKLEEDRLRAYQLQRLRYYYAVVECDSPETAKAIYDACDGAEYEKSSNVLDLRYIPDEEEFEQEPRDQATQLPDAESFNPTEFTTKALQHSDVALTWDADDVERLKVTKRKFNREELKRMDFEAYVASDDDSSDDEEESSGGGRKSSAAAYRALVGQLKQEQEADEPAEMEIQWDMALTDKSKQLAKTIESRGATNQAQTLGEQYQQIRKDKRKARRAAKKAGLTAEESGEDGLEDDDEDLAQLAAEDPYFAEELASQGPGKSGKGGKGRKGNKSGKGNAEAEDDAAVSEAQLARLVGVADEKHFNMNEIVANEGRSKKTLKRRAKKRQEEVQEDTFKVDVEDPRFAAMYNSHEFSIDPTNASFHKTKNMERLLEERNRRSRQRGGRRSQKSKSQSANADSAPAVAGLDSVVRKLQQQQPANKRSKR